MEPAKEIRFWGKYVSEGERFLPLAAHCLDVGLVFRGLCGLGGIRRALEHASGEQLSNQQLERLAVLAMLHDAGKANLGFQRKVFTPSARRAGHIRELAPLLDFDALDVELHEAFLRALPANIPGWFENEESAYSYLLAVFSHHGRPLRFKGEKQGTYWVARKDWWRPQGLLDPMAGIADIVRWSETAFPEAFAPTDRPLPIAPRAHHRFAGLVMLADWLASSERWFPVRQEALASRLSHGRTTVPTLLQATGLDTRRTRAATGDGLADFRARFDRQPFPLQAAIDALDPSDEATALVIAESETGSGKTEAALDWFFKLFVGGYVDSLYFALPTRVAATELHGRVRQAIGRWFPDAATRPVTVLAVPGYSLSFPDSEGLTLADAEPGSRFQDDETLQWREKHWAAERPKRFLAATVAVGTIDQALLSAVQTAHAHLRSVCLDRSLLVVDEAHASDHYMTCLLEALLEHHLSTGGRAILLSATLGSRARSRFVGTIHSEEPASNRHDAAGSPYPALTLADGIVRPVEACDAQAKRVRFEVVPWAFTPENVTKLVIAALQAGARILAVLNTVARANTLLRALESATDVDPSWLFSCNEVICPHHGRFAPEDRVVLDKAVRKRLGRDSSGGALFLAGTQTLEQSLDIDADLLISDLAPADVLLQRVGRLHRSGRLRPPGYESPLCILLAPPQGLDGALDERGAPVGKYMRLGYGSVYPDLRTLELTRRILLELGVVVIPHDCRRLVEAVTHPESLFSLSEDRWQLHGRLIEGGEIAQAVSASHALAVFDEYFGDVEFNESGGRVVTRLGADSLQLPLDRHIRSPFGQDLTEIVIPGHMAPRKRVDAVSVAQSHGDSFQLQCGDRSYLYSRFGLEESQ